MGREYMHAWATCPMYIYAIYLCMGLIVPSGYVFAISARLAYIRL